MHVVPRAYASTRGGSESGASLHVARSRFAAMSNVEIAEDEASANMAMISNEVCIHLLECANIYRSTRVRTWPSCADFPAVWKKNSPFLYDMVITHALEWPTLTLQWMPDKEVFADKGFTRHRFLMGTHTSGQDNNYLQIATVNLPNYDANGIEGKLDIKDYDEEKGGMYLPYVHTRNRFLFVGIHSHSNYSAYQPRG